MREDGFCMAVCAKKLNFGTQEHICFDRADR